MEQAILFGYLARIRSNTRIRAMQRRAFVMGSLWASVAGAQPWDRHAAALASRGTAAESVWESLRRGGMAVLIRHTTAPGRGDPANFDLARCETQRNLSDEGREEARALGRVLQQQRVKVGAVFSSQYCRVAETARLVSGPEQTVQSLPLLNSSFEEERPLRERRAQALRRQIRALSSQDGGNTLMFSHAFNIDDAFGIWLENGEMLVVRTDAEESSALVGKLGFAAQVRR
jgi:phosphohistidine phosphatase SixA